MADHQPSAAMPSSLAHLGALIGDPVRAAILLHLSDGSRRPAGELATLAGSSQQAVSAHLAQLVEGGLLKMERQGRHRFFSIASGDVAEVIEGLVNWLDMPRRGIVHDSRMRAARLCYDHLGGQLGVQICDRMTTRGFLEVGSDGATLSEAGRSWCRCTGLDPAKPPGTRRPMVRLCLDWTERRNHLGGHFGAVVAAKMLTAGFVSREPKGRALRLTADGAAFLKAELELRVS